MTTPADFVSTCETVVEDLALFYVGTPDEAVKRSLDDMFERVEAGWRETFKAFASAEDITGVVDDLRVRIQARRREIEAGGASLNRRIAQ
jgi:hypothetical protein